MRLITTIVLLVFLSLAVVAQRKPRGATPHSSQPEKQKIFPYEYTIDDLPNGLRLVTIPTDFPNIVAVYTVVRAGARNEVEHGKSGYAHLFEHLMFRGSEHYTPEQRDAILKRAGADDNAYTTDDRTVFHEVFSKEDLDTILQLNADTFERLKYSPDAYKTETKAVLGEFNKNSSNPTEKLFEVLRATAYRKHTYEHTAMGFIKDIEDMPNQYDYSLQFYQRYYRPENVIIMVVGDVQHAQTLAMVKKYFGDWKRGDYTPQIPSEPEQTSPREEHIDWPSPTLPYVDVAFRGPAYSDTDIDHVADAFAGVPVLAQFGGGGRGGPVFTVTSSAWPDGGDRAGRAGPGGPSPTRRRSGSSPRAADARRRRRPLAPDRPGRAPPPPRTGAAPTTDGRAAGAQRRRGACRGLLRRGHAAGPEGDRRNAGRPRHGNRGDPHRDRQQRPVGDDLDPGDRRGERPWSRHTGKLP